MFHLPKILTMKMMISQEAFKRAQEAALASCIQNQSIFIPSYVRYSKEQLEAAQTKNAQKT